MKLASLVLATLLAAAGSARADEVLQPPGGAVYVSDPPMQQQRGQRGKQGKQGKQLRRAMLDTFDANGDGRLGPRERMRAIRVLRRIEQRLGEPGARDQRQRGARRGEYQ